MLICEKEVDNKKIRILKLGGFGELCQCNANDERTPEFIHYISPILF